MPIWKVSLDPADQAGAIDFRRWLSVGGGSACRAFAEWQVKTHLPESDLYSMG